VLQLWLLLQVRAAGHELMGIITSIVRTVDLGAAIVFVMTVGVILIAVIKSVNIVAIGAVITAMIIGKKSVIY
jgi:hypothetical protein